MLGTILNIVAVLIGSAIGILAGNRLPERTRQIVINGLGLVVAVVGMQAALQTRNVLILMFSILLGGILGEWWGIEDRLEALGHWLERRFSGAANAAAGSRSITRAFVTASLVFCVGPLTIVGSIQDGLTGDYTLLAIKSMLDGFAAIAFAATLGPGVVLAGLTILVYQGGLSLATMGFSSSLGGVTRDAPAIIEMTAAGGVLMLGISLLLLDLKRVRVANFLPALALAPLITGVLMALGVK
ncbi:MAG: DUF554 domain-containing protein [Anaerolineae bacterium]|nr:DUF554 domain-containing protein [Anaerolineae bacterium]